MRALLALLPLLALAGAGCLEGGEPPAAAAPAPSLFAVAPDALEAGGAYAFDHPGGPLVLSAPEGAEVVLYGPDDARVARVPLAAGRSAVATVAAGEAVLRVLAVNGTLRVAPAAGADDADAGTVTRFRPLPVHMERVALVARGEAPMPLLPDVPAGREPFESDEERSFARVPVDLRLLASGGYEDLNVVVSGARGVALEVAHASGGGLFGEGIFPGGGFLAVEAQVFPDNLEGAGVRVRVQAAHLDGALVLEAWSYSRAQPPEPAGAAVVASAGAQEGGAGYEYGEVPDRPAAFSVHPRAQRLLLSNPGAGAAVVALFGPQDERLGLVPVAPGATVSVPTRGAGTYVAVALAGAPVLGADRAPADLDSLHVLERGEALVPAQPPGQDGYQETREQARTPGVLYAALPSLRPVGFDGTTVFGCSSGGTVRIAQDGETIGVAGDLPQAEGNASFLLRDGPVEVVADGFGGGCSDPVFVLQWYGRPGGGAP